MAVVAALAFASIGAAQTYEDSPDIDLSGRVDHLDLLQFLRYWQGNAHSRADLSGDFKIDERDLVGLVNAFHVRFATPPADLDLAYGQALIGQVSAGQESVYRFLGSAGDTFSIVVDALGSLKIAGDLIGPDGSVLAVFATTTSTNDARLEEYQLVADGTIEIRIRPRDGTSGFYGIGLSDRPIEPPVSLEEAQVVEANLDPLADDDLFVFTGATGQTVRVLVERLSGTLSAALSATLYAPDGSTVIDSMDYVIPGGTGGDRDSAAFETTLTQDGTYTLLVDSETGPGGGPYRVAYYGLRDIGQAVDGEFAVEAELERGEYADYRFTGQAGQYISATLDIIDTPEWEAALQLIQVGAGGAETILIEQTRAGQYRLDDRNITTQLRLPANGEYIIRVRSNTRTGGANAGRYVLYVSDYNAPPQVIQYGDVIEGEIAPIADDDLFTFTAEANDRVRIVGVRRDLSRGGLLRAMLMGPDNALVTMNIPSTRANNPSDRGITIDTGGFLLEAQLPQAGTYTLIVDAREIYGTGGYKIWVFKGAITRETVTPGQIVYGTLGHLDVREYAFEAARNDVFSVQLDGLQDEFPSQFPGSGITETILDMTLFDVSDPFSQPKQVFTVAGRSGSGTVYEETGRLPSGPQQPGTPNYVLRIVAGRDADYTTVGDFVLYLSDWNETRSPTPLVDGVEVVGDLDPIADDDIFTFEGQPGETFHIIGRVDNPNVDPQLRGTLYGPNAAVVAGPNKRLTGDTNGFELLYEVTMPGTHLLMVDLDERNGNFRTGRYRVTMSKAAIRFDTVAPGDIVFDTIRQGRTRAYEFNAAAGDFVSFWVDALGTPDGTRNTDPLGVLDIDVRLFNKNQPGVVIDIPAETGGGRNDYRLDNWRVPATSTYQLVITQGTGNAKNTVGAYALYLGDHHETPRALVNDTPQIHVLDPFVDDDLFQFEAGAGETVTVRVERPGGDRTSPLRAVLFGPGRTGPIVATGITLTDPPTLADTGGAQILNQALSQAGTYYVLVDEEGPTNFSNDSSPGRGVYQITLNPVGIPTGPDEDNGGANPVPVSFGSSIGARIASAGDTDTFTLEVGAEHVGRPFSIFVHGHLRTGIGENLIPEVTLMQGGSQVAVGTKGSNNAFIDDFVPTTAGTYSIIVGGEIPTRGVYGLAVSDLPEAAPMQLEPNGFVAAAIERLGDEDDFTVEGAEGDRLDVFLRRSDQSGPSQLTSTLTLLDDSGAVVRAAEAGPNPSLSGVGFPSAGVFTVRVESNGASAGNYLLETALAPVEPEADTIAFGEQKTGHLRAERETAHYTFAVSANEQGKTASIITVGLSVDTFVQLQDPSGVFVAGGLETGRNAVIDDMVLSEVGTYTIVVSSNGSDRSGVFRVGLSDLPVETPTAIGIGGSAGQDIAPLADEDAFTFSGTAGRRIDIGVLTGIGVGNQRLDADVTLLLPDGSALAVDTDGLNAELVGIELPEDGQYTILVEPALAPETGGAYEGLYSLLLSDTTTPGDTAGTIAFGQEKPGELTQTGEIHNYTLSVTAEHVGKRVSIAVAGDTVNADLLLVRPDATEVAAPPASRDAYLDDLLLDQEGDYLLTVTGNAADPVGTYRIGVSDRPVEAPRAIAFGQTLVDRIAPLADEDLFTFDNSGTTVDVLVSTAEDAAQQVDADVTLLDPDGNELATMAEGISPSLLGVVLPSTGTYAILVEPAGVTTGGYRVTLRHTPVKGATEAIAFGQEIQGALAPGEGADVYAFTVGQEHVGRAVSIVAISVTVNTDLALYDPAGDKVATYTSGSHSLIDDFVLNAAGEWLICVSSPGNQTGTYIVGLSDRPVETPEPLQTTGRTLDYVGDEDTFTFRPGSSPVSIRVAPVGSSMNLNLKIFDSRGRLVGQSLKYTDLDGETYSHTGIIERFVGRTSGDHILLVEPGLGFLTDGVAKGSYSITFGPATVAPVAVAGVEIESGTEFQDALGGGDVVRNYVFQADAGDFISAQLLNTTLKMRLTLYPPFGGESADSVLAQDEARSDGENLAFDDVRAPGMGPYVLRVFNLSGVAGNYTIRVSRGRLSEAIAVPAGATAEKGLLPVGDDDVYTFVGKAGDVIQAGFRRTGGSGTVIGRLFDPAGRPLLYQSRPRNRIDANGSFFELELPVSGTYYAVCDTQQGDRTPAESATAEFSVLRRTIIEQEIEYGTSRTATLDRMDQAIFTFAGSAGDRVSMEVVPDPSTPGHVGPNRMPLDPDMQLYSPNGDLLASDTDQGTTNATRLDDLVLPLDGNYRIVVFPNGTWNDQRNPDNAGDFELFLSDGPADTPVALTIGQPADGQLDPVADDDYLTFQGQVGESYQVRLVRPSTTLPQVDMVLYDPGMQAIATGANYDSTADRNGRILFVTLPASGTYTIHVDVVDDNRNVQRSSSYQVAVFQRQFKTAAIVPGTSAIDDLGPVDIHTYTFPAQAGDIVSLEAGPGATALNVDLELRAPTGAVMRTSSTVATEWTARIDDVVLPVGGEYQILVFANGRETDSEAGGTYTLYVSDGPTDPPAALTRAAATLGSLETFADDDFFTIAGTANQSVSIELLRQAALEDAELALKAFGPNGEFLGESTSTGADPGGGQLTVTFGAMGSIQILVDSEKVLETSKYVIRYDLVQD